MRAHSILYDTRQVSVLCVTVLRLALRSISIRAAMDLQMPSEAATHDRLTQFIFPHRLASHASLPPATHGAPVSLLTTPVSPLPGISPESAVVQAGLPYTENLPHRGESQSVLEYTGLGKEHSASRRASTEAAAVAQQSLYYERMTAAAIPVAKPFHFPGRPNRAPPLLGHNEVFPMFQPLPRQVQPVQHQTTMQPKRVDEKVRMQGAPAQEFTGTFSSQSQQRSAVHQRRHQAEARMPLHRYYEQQQPHQKQHHQLQRQQQEELQHEWPQTASTLPDHAELASFNVHPFKDDYADVRLRTPSLQDTEAEIARSGATPARWARKEHASRTKDTSHVPRFTRVAEDVHRDILGLQAPLRVPHESTSFTSSPHRSEPRESVKVAQTGPANPDPCNIEATLPHICYSGLECPTLPPDSRFQYGCLSPTSTVESLPGVCRLGCSLSGTRDTFCPLGQTCALTSPDLGVCVDVCPPDGLPPCTRRVCGTLDSCIRNYCRTPGALIEPSLCTPALRSIDEDYFCEGPAASIGTT